MQVKNLFELLDHKPKAPKEAYTSAWDLRMLWAFALKRSRDATNRGQTPRVPYLQFGYMLTVESPHVWCRSEDVGVRRLFRDITQARAELRDEDDDDDEGDEGDAVSDEAHGEEPPCMMHDTSGEISADELYSSDEAETEAEGDRDRPPAARAEAPAAPGSIALGKVRMLRKHRPKSFFHAARPMPAMPERLRGPSRQN